MLWRRRTPYCAFQQVTKRRFYFLTRIVKPLAYCPRTDIEEPGNFFMRIFIQIVKYEDLTCVSGQGRNVIPDPAIQIVPCNGKFAN